jgi:hypothetical protein
VEDVEGGEDEDWSPDLATSPIPDQTSWDRGPARRQVEEHLFLVRICISLCIPIPGIQVPDPNPGVLLITGSGPSF